MNSPGLTVFIMFFGLSLVEAFWSRNWVSAAIWFGCGALFWVLDRGIWSRPTTKSGRSALER